MKKALKNTDTLIAKLISLEHKRQKNTLMMIPSENYTSIAVQKALGSVLTNKYSEGYPHARYYQGNKYIDEIETLAIERAKKLFGVAHANVQPYSGSPANTAVYFALLERDDVIMGLNLAAGGHLTHGHPKVTFSGKYFTSVQYDVDENGWINLDEVEKLAKKVKPKIIVVGTTAYPRIFDWKRWRAITDLNNSWLLADISHIAGLVVAGVYPSPTPYADIIMTTTHKTLRGPRGAILMITKRGLEKDPDLAKKIDRAVFPGLQGGPHDNTTAAIATALYEASQPSFKKYGQQIIKNSQTLTDELKKAGLTLTTDGTDNHLMVVDLRPQRLFGNIVAEALEVAGIVVNRNSVPHDQNPPFYPSGIRLGTPALTTRGMKQKEMKQIAKWIIHVINMLSKYQTTYDKQDLRNKQKEFRKDNSITKQCPAINNQVNLLCQKFPI